jgi:hypothetical protein
MVIILMNEVASSLPFLFGLCKRRRTEKSVWFLFAWLDFI